MDDDILGSNFPAAPFDVSVALLEPPHLVEHPRQGQISGLPHAPVTVRVAQQRQVLHNLVRAVAVLHQRRAEAPRLGAQQLDRRIQAAVTLDEPDLPGADAPSHMLEKTGGNFRMAPLLSHGTCCTI